jgi:hypothetical protein
MENTGTGQDNALMKFMKKQITTTVVSTRVSIVEFTTGVEKIV